MSIDRLDQFREEMRLELRAGFAEVGQQIRTFQEGVDQRFVDLETGLRQEIAASAIETRQYVDHVTGGILRQVDAVEAGLRQRIDAVDAGLRHHVDAVEAGLHQHVVAVAGEIREHADGIAAENRRHMGVLVESMQTSLELVIKGVTMVDQKVDRLRTEVHDEFEKFDRRLVRVAARIPRPKRRT